MAGVNYTLSDSESLEVNPGASKYSLKLNKNDSGQLEVGKPLKPSTNKRSPRYVKSTLRCKQKRSTTTNKESRDLFETEDSAVNQGFDWLEQQPMETSHFESLNLTSEHTEELLFQIGTNVEHPQTDLPSSEGVPREDRDKTSCSNLLDDILLAGDVKKPPRRPPPKATRSCGDKYRRKCTNSVAVQLDELFSESAAAEHINTGGTLKNESIDCFSDPLQWRKKNRKRINPMGAVDKLISEGNTEYENLFLEGKMKKREREPKGRDSPKNNERDENQSLSLF